MDWQAFLRRERLLLNDPYAQENLLPKEKLPLEAKEVRFDNAYYVPNEKIYCHICGAHRHNKGITGVLLSEHRLLFGSSCARQYFGNVVYDRARSDFKKRTQRATNRFLILEIANSVDDVSRWLQSYRPLADHQVRAWQTIHIRHSQAIQGLLNNIQKNSGRLVETLDVTVGGNALQSRAVQRHRILTSFTGYEVISYLTNASQQATLVEAFVEAVRSVKHEPDDQLFENLARMYKKTLNAAQQLDQFMQFTAEFFSLERLAISADWIERRRRERLRDQAEIRPQNLKYKFRDIIGHGVEKPHSTLSAAMEATGIPAKLHARHDMDISLMNSANAVVSSMENEVKSS